MKDNDTAFDERLALGWQALSPSPDALERVRARLPATPPHGPDMPREASSQRALPASRWRALRATGGLGTGAGGLLLGLGFVAGWFAHDEWAVPLQGVSTPAGRDPRVSEAAQPAARAVGTPDASSQTGGGAMSSAEAASTPAPMARGGSAKPRPAAGGPKPALAPHAVSAVDLELALIQRAERAVRAKNGELALALSAELDDKYPSTRFNEERQAIALMARCQTGSPDRIVERERFAQRYPSSVYGERVALECGPEASPRE